MIEVGRVCVKTAGRERGSRCVVVDVLDGGFVLVTGPKALTGVRRRRVNIKHLKPTEMKLEIRRGCSDERAIEVLEKAGLAQAMKQPA
ncbi:MAG: 50S ribosomal protein L14e [Candidatus Bathyarchaeia archaeon]